MDAIRPTTVAVAAALIIAGFAGCASEDTTARPAPSIAATIPAAAVDTADRLLPAPTGPNAVGVTAVGNIGTSRATMWYPAKAGTAGWAPAAYLSPDLAAAFGLDAEAQSALDPHAGIDSTPRTEDVAPVAILTTGWATPLALSTSLAEDLASHGWVVVGLDPELGSESPERPPSDADGRRRIHDIRAAVDAVTGRRLSVGIEADTSRVVVGGHSFGGATAFEAALEDDRITAVFNLDGSLHRAAATTPPPVPSLLVSTTAPGEMARAGGWERLRVVALRDAAHFDVTDVAAIGPALGDLAALFETGGIGPAGTRATNTAVRRFLADPDVSDRELVDGIESHVHIP